MGEIAFTAQTRDAVRWYKADIDGSGYKEILSHLHDLQLRAERSAIGVFFRIEETIVFGQEQTRFYLELEPKLSKREYLTLSADALKWIKTGPLSGIPYFSAGDVLIIVNGSHTSPITGRMVVGDSTAIVIEKGQECFLPSEVVFRERRKD